MKLTLLSLLFFLSLAGSSQVFGPQIVISNELNSPKDVQVADIDGDGDIDVLAASQLDQTIAWFENVNGVFGPLNVISTNADGARAVFPADIDGDGDFDVLSASFNDGKLAWYVNDGEGNFGPEILIATIVGASNVHADDLDGDGDQDVMCSSNITNNPVLYWFENDGEGTFEQHNFGIWAYIGTSVTTGDLDGDGDPDVLCTAYGADRIAWTENVLPGFFLGEHLVSTTADGVTSIHTADIDGDGDLDVVATSQLDDQVVWHQNNGNGYFSDEIVISENLQSPFSVYSSDIDGDGDMDVVAASIDESKVAWYQNDGLGNFSDDLIISTQAHHAVSVITADINGDGKLDVLSASSNDAKIAWYPQLSEGCTDPTACNYDSNVSVDVDSCCYDDCGCTNTSATNYAELAVCDDGTCSFLVSGLVYNDINFNGEFDVDEYGLAFQSVNVQPGDITIITDAQGEFDIELGDYNVLSFSHVSDPFFPAHTTESSQSFSSTANASAAPIQFGISAEVPAFDIEVNLYNGNGFLCDDWTTHTIVYQNMGNVPMDGIVEFEYDGLFQGHEAITPLDSSNANIVYLSFQNLLPGQYYACFVNLLSPTVDYIGEILSSHARVTGFFNDNQVAFGEVTLETEVTCAYDPNDKQVFPVGFTEEHLILENTNLDYLLRFQNTGNAPATNILVTDTIDENLDLGSFQLKASSHSVMVTIRPDLRVIEFYFENIMLPDSTNNEPESHGLVLYQIEPKTGLSAGTVLHNTANIYFDNNPPIITNTTWTTIHECGGEAEFSIESEVSCLGQVSSFSSLYPWVEDYTWSLDGEETSNASTFETNFTALGEYTVLLEASNPLCTSVSSIAVIVDDLTDTNPCPGDFNCDGERTVGDLNAFLTEFGCNLNCLYDLNGDGITATNDLVVFLSYFGSSCAE